jgi:vacuolar-type H+-ATPase subunit H
MDKAYKFWSILINLSFEFFYLLLQLIHQKLIVGFVIKGGTMNRCLWISMLALLALFTGCARDSADRANEKMDESADKVSRKIEDAATRAVNKIDKATEDSIKKIDQATDRVQKQTSEVVDRASKRISDTMNQAQQNIEQGRQNLNNALNRNNQTYGERDYNRSTESND